MRSSRATLGRCAHDRAAQPPTVPVAAEDPEADARTRASLAPPERPVIGFIGLLSAAAKGFEELLEALARTDALLVATGSLDRANAYHAHIGAEIQRLGLGERVRWLGFVPTRRPAVCCAPSMPSCCPIAAVPRAATRACSRRS